MSSVASAIASLLYDHDTVIVPGLGAFIRHDQSAHVNVITNEFKRPTSHLDFDPRQREENTLVCDYLVTYQGLTNDEARAAIASFVNECFAQLRVEHSMSLPEIGTLSMDEQQNLSFMPDNTNFNSNAFGLEDLNPHPVYGTPPPSDTIVTPADPDNVVSPTDSTSVFTPADSDSGFTPSDSNNVFTPSDSNNVFTPSDSDDVLTPVETHHSRWWIWLLVILLLAAGVALWYFFFRPIPTKPWPTPNLQRHEIIQPPVVTTQPNDTLTTSADTLLNPTTPPQTPTEVPTEIPSGTSTKTPSGTPSETAPQAPPKPQGPGPMTVVKPEPTSKSFIVGGCFSVEKNALNMLVEAREQGCAEAFVMKRGSKFFVCYGQYSSTAEAKKALPVVLDNYNPKAWILNK